MCDAACRREVGKMIIDILLGLKAGGIPRHRSAALGISGLQTPKPPHRSNRCGTGRWVVSWECHISASALASAPAPGTPLVCQSRTPTPTPRVGCASGPPTPTDSDLDFSGHGHGHGHGVTFTASPVVVVCTESTPWFQRGRTLTLTLTLILEPPVSGARRHWGRNHWADIDIYICAVCGENCVEFPL